jgi:uncharacterized membrane protein
MGKRFVIYGLLGLCAEVLWTGLGSMINGDMKLTGSTYIWMFPIYGLAVFLEPIHNRIRHLSLFTRGGVYMVLIFAAEFTCGLLLKELLGACPWNYEDEHLSIYGIITLRYIPVWFATGLIFEKIHDTLIRIEHIIINNKFSNPKT